MARAITLFFFCFRTATDFKKLFVATLPLLFGLIYMDEAISSIVRLSIRSLSIFKIFRKGPRADLSALIQHSLPNSVSLGLRNQPSFKEIDRDAMARYLRRLNTFDGALGITKRHKTRNVPIMRQKGNKANYVSTVEVKS